MCRTPSLIFLICCAAATASAQVKSVAAGAETMSASAHEDGIAIPPEIEEKLDWISQAELAAKGSGAIEELPPSARVAAAGLLRAAKSVTEPGPDGCHVVVEGSDGSEGELVPPAKKAQGASRAFLGEVVALERGLAHGTPAIVYEVRIGDLIRWPESAVVAQTGYILHYGGSVVVDGRILCSTSSFLRGEQPEIGSEVALLADEIALERPFFLNAFSGTFYFKTPRGRVAGPWEKAAEPSDWETFVQSLREKGREQ